MCFVQGSHPTPATQTVAAPPPPPPRDPMAPQINARDQNSRDAASSNRQGTSIFRNDLSIPASPIGSGINLPR